MEASASLNLNIAQFLAPGVDVERARQVLSLSDIHMLEEGIDTDITLEAQGGFVRAHRFVLVSLSSDFKDWMFENQMRGELPLPSVVAFPEMTIGGLELFLVLLYGSSKQAKTWQVFQGAVDMHFPEIFEACCRYEIIRLVPTLNEALPRHLTRENCWDWYRKSLDLSRLCQSVGLKAYCHLPNICVKYIVENSVQMNQMSL